MNDTSMTIAVSNDQQADRQAYSQLIIDSEVTKKVIVAGPGTGKTTTFEGILKHTGSINNLVLTFINRLVADLSCRLDQYATVMTLQGLCIISDNRLLRMDSWQLSIFFLVISDINPENAQLSTIFALFSALFLPYRTHFIEFGRISPIPGSKKLLS